MSTEHTLICTGCGEPIGHEHNEECKFAPGIVVASQSVEASSQPRCRDCKQRVGTSHLSRCNYYRIETLGASVTEEQCDLPDPREAGKEDYSSMLAERASKAVADLQSGTFPDLVVVKMHSESATTPEAVMECVEGELAREAEVVIGIWSSGHVVVGKHNYGRTGTAVAAIEGQKALGQESEWPSKLIWGCFRRPGTGMSGVVFNLGDIPELKERYPDAEFEPYVPVRNLKRALQEKASEAAVEAEKGGIPNHIERREARANAFDDAVHLLSLATWTVDE